MSTYFLTEDPAESLSRYQTLAGASPAQVNKDINPGQDNFLWQLYNSAVGLLKRTLSPSEWATAVRAGPGGQQDTAYLISLHQADLAIAAQPTITPEIQAASDTVNALNAQAAVVQAKAQLTLSQQLASDTTVPPAAPGPSLISSVGGNPIGFLTPPPAAPKPAIPAGAWILVLAAAAWFFGRKFFKR